MLPVGDSPGTSVGIPGFPEGEGSEECLATPSAKWPSTLNSRISDN